MISRSAFTVLPARSVIEPRTATCPPAGTVQVVWPLACGTTPTCCHSGVSGWRYSSRSFVGSRWSSAAVHRSSIFPGSTSVSNNSRTGGVGVDDHFQARLDVAPLRVKPVESVERADREPVFTVRGSHIVEMVGSAARPCRPSASACPGRWRHIAAPPGRRGAASPPRRSGTECGSALYW